MATFSLSTPIEFTLSGAHGPIRRERITEVKLRKVRAGDLRLLEQHRGQPASLVLYTIAALSGLTPGRVKKISIDDYAPIAVEALKMMSRASSEIGVRPEFFIPPDAKL